LHFPPSQTAFYRITRKLFRAQYLVRIPDTVLKAAGLESHLPRHAGPLAYEAMAPSLRLSPNSYRPRPLRPLFLLHELNLYKFLAALEYACYNHARVKLHLERPQRLIVNNVVVIPDGKVILEHYHEPSPGNKATFYLDLHMRPQQIVECYTQRWSIETTCQECREYLNLESPKCYGKHTI
jgi:hypothetical protein